MSDASSTPGPAPHTSPPLVSVVIATRDRPDLLRAALRSVFSQQGYPDVEAIVVFDQSEPDESLKDSFDSRRLQILSNLREPGLAGARNTGYLASTAEWVAYLDDDDEWLPNKLDLQLALADEDPEADMIVGGLLIDADGNRVPRPHASSRISHQDLLRSRVAEAHPSTFLMRRRPFLDRIGLMDEGLRMATDYDLLLRYTVDRDVRAVVEPVVRIRMHQASYFTTNWDNRIALLDQLLERHPDFDTVPEGLARLKGQRAIALAASGRRREALRECLSAFRLNWREKRTPLALAISLSLLSPDYILRQASKRGRGI